MCRKLFKIPDVKDLPDSYPFLYPYMLGESCMFTPGSYFITSRHENYFDWMYKHKDDANKEQNFRIVTIRLDMISDDPVVIEQFRDEIKNYYDPIIRSKYKV